MAGRGITWAITRIRASRETARISRQGDDPGRAATRRTPRRLISLFYTATSGRSAFPKEYLGDGFAVLHGSWNRALVPATRSCDYA